MERELGRLIGIIEQMEKSQEAFHDDMKGFHASLSDDVGNNKTELTKIRANVGLLKYVLGTPAALGAIAFFAGIFKV